MSQLVNGLQTQIVRFIKFLRENILTRQEDIDNSFLVELFFANMGGYEIMDHAVSKLLPWKNQIVERDENFFLTNTFIFKGLPQEQIEYFGKLLGGDQITPVNKEAVWKFFDVFVVFAEEFKKMK